MSDFSAKSLNLIKQLDEIIGKAFIYESEFMNHFWPECIDCVLLECHLASEKTRIAVLSDSGKTITTTISTIDFLNWVESRYCIN